MLGLGIDVVELERIRRALERWGNRFATRILTSEEFRYCREKPHLDQSVAVRFAAKEAFFKALPGSNKAQLGWHDFAMLNTIDGRPYASLSARARQLLGNHKVHVSVSHSAHTAVAAVVLE